PVAAARRSRVLGPLHVPAGRGGLPRRARDARRVADGIATADGAEAAVELIRGYPVTSNDASFAGCVRATAREGPGAERVTPMSHPVMGSEDFSYVLQRVPGAMANLGTRPDSGEVYPNHSNRMLVNETALASGMAVHVAVALRFFERGGGIGAAARPPACW